MKSEPLFGSSVQKASNNEDERRRYDAAAERAMRTNSLSRHSGSPLFGGRVGVEAECREAGGRSGLIGPGISFGILNDSAMRGDAAKAETGLKLHPIAAKHTELSDLARRMLSIFAGKADALPPGTAIDVTGTALAGYLGVSHEAASAALGTLVATRLRDRRHGGSLGNFLGYTIGRDA